MKHIPLPVFYTCMKCLCIGYLKMPPYQILFIAHTTVDSAMDKLTDQGAQERAKYRWKSVCKNKSVMF